MLRTLQLMSLCGLLPWSPSRATGQEIGTTDVTLEEIRAAHAERVGRIETLKIMVHMTGVLSILPEEAAAYRGAPGPEFSGEFVIHKSDFITLTRDSQRVDSVADQINFNVSGGIDRDTPETSVFHEGIYKNHMPSFSQGSVTQRNSTLARSSLGTKLHEIMFDARPPHLYRPSLAVLRTETFAQGELTVVGTTDYNASGRRGKTRIEYYLDPNREYLLIGQLMMYPDGTPGTERWFEYAMDEKGFIIPTRATSNRMRGKTGEIESSMTFEITGVAINDPIDDSVFELEFPRGTRVYDGVDHPEGAKYREYTVGEDEPEEAEDPAAAWVAQTAKTFERLEAAAPDFEPTPLPRRARGGAASGGADGTPGGVSGSPGGSPWPLILAAVVLALIGAGALAMRRRF